MPSLPNPAKLRVIKTARTEAAINKAATAGFRPLVKWVEPFAEAQTKLRIAQHPQTGEIKLLGDYRSGLPQGYEEVIPWTHYQPVEFLSPFAAYLLPPDLAVGERVFVQDLIENFVGARWNQGSVSRLASAEAIWDGQELRIQYNPETDARIFIG